MKTCDIMLYLCVFAFDFFYKFSYIKLIKNFSYKREKKHKTIYIERVRKKKKINDLNKSGACCSISHQS